MLALSLLGILFFVGLNAFFVAAEFSLVAMRPSRIEQLIDLGDARAAVVKSLMADLDRVLSGVQVGITLASLSLGIVGEAALARLFLPLFAWLPIAQAAIVSHAIATGLSFAILTFLHVVLGELVPKSLALQRTEGMALIVARPLRWFIHWFRWLIDGLDAASRRIVRLLGVANPMSHALVHSAEELLILVQQVGERGVLRPGQEQFIQGAVELSKIQAREIMVARPDMHLLPAEADLDEVMRAFATTQRSRIPVYQGTPDHILGFIHIKDVVWVLLDRERRAQDGQPQAPFNMRTLLREVLIVPETKPASELLIEMRTRRVNLAMVVDEFGTILGLVTLEDVLEEMVGEIHDEFDVVERPLTLSDGALVFDGAVNVRDLEAKYSIHIPEDPDYETVGGFVLAQLGFLPRGGEAFDFDGLRFTVVEMDRRRVARVKIQQIKPPEPVTAEHPAAEPPAAGPPPPAPAG
ncbi:MAG: hemolysin family protein [Candidatus Acidiferrales bacterium]